MCNHDPKRAARSQGEGPSGSGGNDYDEEKIFNKDGAQY